MALCSFPYIWLFVFFLADFRILSLSFSILIMICLSVGLFRFIPLCFLYPNICFLLQVWGFFSYNFIKYIFHSFLPLFSFWYPYDVKVGAPDVVSLPHSDSVLGLSWLHPYAPCTLLSWCSPYPSVELWHGARGFGVGVCFKLGRTHGWSWMRLWQNPRGLSSVKIVSPEGRPC